MHQQECLKTYLDLWATLELVFLVFNSSSEVKAVKNTDFKKQHHGLEPYLDHIGQNFSTYGVVMWFTPWVLWFANQPTILR